MVLRLPITSIEKYHLIDDPPANPNVMGCRIVVSGDLDLAAANLAAEETLRRHPLLCAHLQRGRFGRLYWANQAAAGEGIQWELVPDQMRFESPHYIDLWQGPPMRITIRKDAKQTVLDFYVHHAVVDGLGALQTLTDWLISYHRIKTPSDKPKLRQLDPQQLKYRNNLRLLSRKFLFKLWIQPIAMLGATKFMFRKVQSIATSQNRQPDVAATQDFQLISRGLSAEEFVRLQEHARSANASINEFLIRSVFLGLHRFRQETGRYQQGQWLRLMIPINIRDYADRRLPAANRASIVQLDRTDRDFADPDGLIWTFSYELGNIRKWNLEKTFLLMVRLFCLIPGMLKRSAGKDVCRATSVLTNLGAPLDRIKLPREDGKLVAGNLIVESLDLIVPLRSQTPVGFAAVRYAGIQRLTMHFDPAQIGAEEAELLMNLVYEELLRGYQTN